MAVAFDAATESVYTTIEGSGSFSHTAAAGTKGIVVAAVHGVTSTDYMPSSPYGITWDGLSLTRIITRTDTANELGRADLWFLGTGVTTGTKTVAYTLNAATSDDIHFVCFSFTGSADLEVIDSDGLAENAANPTVTLQKGGRTGICVAAMYGGGAAPGGTLAAGNTLSHTHDLGAFYSQTCYETTVDSSDHTIGWSTLTSDDLAFVALCLSEVAAAVNPHLLRHQLVNPMAALEASVR